MVLEAVDAAPFYLVSDVMRFVDLLGVLANAVLGGMIARTERFDPFGFMVMAIMSGLGGGLLRDLLLQKGPPIALTDNAYIVTALVGAAIAFFIPVNERLWSRVFPYVDALALGSWAAAGAAKTLVLGFGWLPALLMGTVTAVGGGAIRDIVLRKVPIIFGGNTLYATSAIAASAVMVGGWQLGVPDAAAIAATSTGFAITVLAAWRGWRLPVAYDWQFGQVVRRIPRPHWIRRS